MRLVSFLILASIIVAVGTSYLLALVYISQLSQGAGLALIFSAWLGLSYLACRLS